MNDPRAQAVDEERAGDNPSRQANSKLGVSLVIAFIAIVVTGYFVGLQAPMTQLEGGDSGAKHMSAGSSRTHSTGNDGDANSPIDSVAYGSMASSYSGPTFQWEHDLTSLSRVTYDPMDPIVIREGEKRKALASREELRAFNGAPPTIPHKIDQMSTTSCMVCHSEGIVSPSLRAPAMSHQFYANCTQCHVEKNSADFTAIEFQPNSFVGLPAPEAGHRAYPGAPPLIPHSTWMRENCLSCHGFTGQEGLKTTHPWRQNCTQCHGPSSALEQAPPTLNRFLPPPSIRAKDEAGE